MSLNQQQNKAQWNSLFERLSGYSDWSRFQRSKIPPFNISNIIHKATKKNSTIFLKHAIPIHFPLISVGCVCMEKYYILRLEITIQLNAFDLHTFELFILFTV